MPPELQDGVNDSDSLTDETSDSLSGKGKSSVKSDERSVENVRKENERKSQEILELRRKAEAYEAELEELRELKKERLEELADKSHLTRSEKDEMSRLEEQIHGIERDQRSKAWIELNKRKSEEIVREKFDTRDLEYAMDMIEDLAEKEGKTREELEKEIKPFLRHFAGERPTRKVRLAYRELLEKRKIDAKLAKLSKDEEVRRETKNSPARPTGRKEILDTALKERNFTEVLKGIEEVQKVKRSGEY